MKEGRKLLRASAGKTPESRYRKILAQARAVEEFSIQDVIAWLPGVPRRTVERDLAKLIKTRELKAKGGSKARTYTRRD